jgi:enterochelin esterase-like enzyme
VGRFRTIALALVLVCIGGVAAAWVTLGKHRPDTHGSRVSGIVLHSKLVHGSFVEIFVTPKRGGKGRPLLVLLHGRSSSPTSFLSDAFFKTLHALGKRAPDVLLVSGGDHSYYHNRRSGKWASYILHEAIPAGLYYTKADPHRVAIGGVSMGGFGALDIARLRPKRFCAVGGRSAALWFQGGDTPAGAFDNAADFARHDLIRFARHRRLYRVPVWMDVGTQDPFRSADTALARILRSHRTRLRFHVWPGGHDSAYWNAHMGMYLRFYADACANGR